MESKCISMQIVLIDPEHIMKLVLKFQQHMLWLNNIIKKTKIQYGGLNYVTKCMNTHLCCVVKRLKHQDNLEICLYLCLLFRFTFNSVHIIDIITHFNVSNRVASQLNNQVVISLISYISHFFQIDVKMDTILSFNKSFNNCKSLYFNHT